MLAKDVQIRLDTFDPDILSKQADTISQAMDLEVKEFSDALVRAKMSPLTPYERSIVKTYMAWKLGLPLAK